MVQVDISIVNIALPTIADQMSTDTSSVSRIVLFYMLAIVSTLLVFGRLGDRIGKKPIFICGYAVFSVSSVLCGISGNLAFLELARVFQGIGGAMLFATFGALIIQNIPEAYRGRAFATVAVFSGIGFAAGAPLGGLIVNHIGWRWIFFINVLPGIVGMVMSKITLKSDRRNRNRGENYDILGVLLSSASLFMLVIALNTGSEHGWFSPKIITLFTFAVVLMGLFIRRERKVADPLIRLKMFSRTKLSAGLLSRLAVTGILNGSVFLFPFFLVKVMEFPIGTIGLLIGIFPAVLLFVSPLSGWLTDRFGPERISVYATILFVVATGLFLGFWFTESLPVLISAFTIFGMAGGLFFPASMKLVMSQAVEGQEGILTAISSLASFLGGLLGICILETVFSLGFPSDHVYSDLPAKTVSSGFGHAMIVTVILALLSLVAAVRTLKRSPGRIG